MVNHVAVFAALGERSRSTMVQRLSTTEASVSELAAEAAISLPATLKHVRVLEEAGLVSRTKRGRTVTVRLQPETLAGSEAWLRRTRSLWTERLEALAASFATDDSTHDDRAEPAADTDGTHDTDATEDRR
ncbi:ArsR/SmtB family transcription factor [Ornithinimicrobium avium]|uniref:ArsR family transcriptional regulator n=1 Tax=Ornithinimicrobium avium TaxID=2283195 RepID=A0A345NMD8_9MICO|nr:metalloregulator ArsR/SmtB family transcription factor [Ornithinimicrobium avium]AXH96196.1 ArsR family transcriptional regulator [Ornithinimicrobium avium]